MDVRTHKTKQIDGAYVWTPDSNSTVERGGEGIVYTDIHTGQKRSVPIPVKQNVWLADLTSDGGWFIFEIRNYLGRQYTIDFMSSKGGEIQKMPNYPGDFGECHPAFSPDGKWMCWNAGGGIAIRKFDPSLPGGTDGKIISPPPAIRTSWVKTLVVGGRTVGDISPTLRFLPAAVGELHSPICILRVADGKTITISPPGWVGHHWDYDWIPPTFGVQALERNARVVPYGANIIRA